uniref:G-protein coupled receptors family 1 profile domain-containing protein n=1 Tax=Eptatretus burgeri TaxID=7764 RepID=A0A8C4QRC3_EPTBU
NYQLIFSFFCTYGPARTSMHLRARNFTFINGLTTHGSLTIVVILSILVFMTTFGNILVLGAAATSERLKQQKSTAFIVSLACADLMMGAVIMPLYISITYIGYWLFGRFLCQLYLVCTILSMNASINTLCVIAIDRYVAITAPLRYESLMTHQRIRGLIVFVWLVSLAIWQYSILSPRKLIKVTGSCLQVRKISQNSSSTTVTTQSKSNGKAHPKQLSTQEHRAIKALGLIMGTFTLCWLPCFSLVSVQVFCNYCISDDVYFTTVWFAYGNSTLNPILYSRRICKLCSFSCFFFFWC